MSLLGINFYILLYEYLLVNKNILFLLHAFFFKHLNVFINKKINYILNKKAEKDYELNSE